MIMTYNNFFVIVHRDFPSTFYPIANYSVSKITKKVGGLISESRDSTIVQAPRP
jgi:hypothetical protein